MLRCRERGKWVEYLGKLLGQGSKGDGTTDDTASEHEECAKAEKEREGQAVSCTLTVLVCISDSDCDAFIQAAHKVSKKEMSPEMMIVKELETSCHRRRDSKYKCLHC